MRKLILVLAALNAAVFGYIGYRKMTDGTPASVGPAAASGDASDASESTVAAADPTPDPSWPVTAEGRFTFQMPGAPARQDIALPMEEQIFGKYYQWTVDATPGAEVIVVAGNHGVSLSGNTAMYETDLDTVTRVITYVWKCTLAQTNDVPTSTGHARADQFDCGHPVTAFVLAHSGIGLAVLAFGPSAASLADRIAASITIDGALALGDDRRVPGIIVAVDDPTS